MSQWVIWGLSLLILVQLVLLAWMVAGWWVQ
jgi:hypothetical protein